MEKYNEVVNAFTDNANLNLKSLVEYLKVVCISDEECFNNYSAISYAAKYAEKFKLSDKDSLVFIGKCVRNYFKFVESKVLELIKSGDFQSALSYCNIAIDNYEFKDDKTILMFPSLLKLFYYPFVKNKSGNVKASINFFYIILLHKAVCLFNLKLNKSAIAEIDKALEMAPIEFGLYSLKIEIQIQSGNYDDALETCKEAYDTILSKNEVAFLLFYYMNIYYNKGNFELCNIIYTFFVKNNTNEKLLEKANYIYEKTKSHIKTKDNFGIGAVELLEAKGIMPCIPKKNFVALVSLYKQFKKMGTNQNLCEEIKNIVANECNSAKILEIVDYEIENKINIINLPSVNMAFHLSEEFVITFVKEKDMFGHILSFVKDNCNFDISLYKKDFKLACECIANIVKNDRFSLSTISTINKIDLCICDLHEECEELKRTYFIEIDDDNIIGVFAKNSFCDKKIQNDIIKIISSIKKI